MNPLQEEMLKQIFIKTGGREENVKIAEICYEIAIRHLQMSDSKSSLSTEVIEDEIDVTDIIFKEFGIDAMDLDEQYTSDYGYLVEHIESIIKKVLKLKGIRKGLSMRLERFKLPTDKQMLEFALIVNEGKIEEQKLADMIAYGQLIIDRLYENGDVLIPSSKEENE